MENSFKFRFLSILLAFMFLYKSTTTQAQSYFAEANSNGFYLKKVVSDTVINTGQTFTYTIYFSIPAGATAVNVSDVIPASLTYHGYTVTAPCGTMNVTSAPTVGSQGGTLALNFPSVATGCSGSISITVSFPNGTTCNNVFANNVACMTGRLGNASVDFCTKGINTQAKAINPWHLNKYVLNTAYQGGACQNVTLDSIITYRLYAWKDVGTTGQLNIYNGVVTDVLPAGAVLIGTPSCGAAMTQSLNTITWNIGAMSSLPSYNQMYCDFQVYYPRSIFPVGSQINNSGTLSGGLGSPNNPCGQASIPSNTTCVEIKPFASGVFSKTAYTTGQPGCGGYYWIQICNNGTLPINGFTVKDTLPTSITTPSVSSTGGGFISNITSGVLTATYAGTLAPTQCAWIKVNFTIPLTATVGSNITNCAWMTSPSLPNAVQSCTTFPVTAPKAQPCLWKEICAKQASYLPGQTFRYRLRVQNIGGQAMTGTTVTDVLDPNLQYVGNPTYYAGTSYNVACSTPALPAGTTAWTGLTFSQSGQTLTWTLPTIGATCQDFFWGNCGQYGTWGVPFYFIEFDVKVKPEACLGNIPNFFAISGGNLPAGVNSNTDYITVAGTAAFNLDKTVSKDNGATYANTATVPSGSNARFRLKFTPTAASTAAMRHVTFVDLLAKNDAANDWYILNRPLARNSQYNFNFLNTFATSPSATTIYDATNSANVKLNNLIIPGVGVMFPYTGGTGTATWTTAAIPANSKNIAYYFGASPIASPNVAQADVDVQIPVGTAAQLNACNTFAGNAAVCHLINSTLMTNIVMAPSESATACVTTLAGNSTACCDSINILQPDATTPPCCSRIQSKNCEIKSVTVNITNGTIGGVTFNTNTATCFNNPSPAIGLTNYTFTPISGVCSNFTAQICPTPAVSGTVIVTYSFTFANGETCRKADTLKCEIPTQTSCCEGAQIVPSQPTVNKCCSQLITKCPVKQVTVDVVGGTLGNVSFAGISGPLYTGLTGSTLTTANFGASVAAVTGLDITVCPKPSANPTIVHYVLYFNDGTKCEKYDTLRCIPVESGCCKEIKVIKLPVQGKCCSQVVAYCPIKNLNISVSNGSLGNVAFAGTNASCFTGVTGSALASANFPASCASNSGFDVTICPTATANPTIITYTTTFATGEICTKKDTLYCIDVPQPACCDSVRIQPSTTPTGQKCCSRITATCPISSVYVNLVGGTISGNAFANPCSILNSPLANGQTSYLFSGACTTLDLQLCATATTSTGTVIVNYIVFFANGQKCEKSDTLKCDPVVIPDCCLGTQIISYESAQKCCSQITTKCPVKLITVNVLQGGTLGNVSFAGTSAGAYTGLTNSGLTSANFAAGSAPTAGIDMTICPTLTSNPMILQYTIYFANGEKCEKLDTLKCDIQPIDCCKETQVMASPNLKCCSQLTSKCFVNNVQVTVVDGVIGTVSFAGVSAGCYTGLTASTLTTTNFLASCSTTGGFDMTICPKATTASGIIIIKYVISFGDGKKCEKTDTLKCDPVVTDNCCKETKVANSTTQKCCSQLTTTCPVRQILVTVVSGGQLGNVTFAGASAGNYTGVSNSALPSANFLITSTGLPTAGMDVTVCPKVTANPTIIRYNITFLNGQQCEKLDTIRCNPVTQADCVINACYNYTASGLLVNLNAGSTTSNQPIVMYYWNFGDGTNAVTTTPTTTHTYATNGTYKLCMTVYTNFGGSLCLCTKEFCREIKVAQGANSAVSCTSGVVGTGVSEIGKMTASPNPSAADFHVKLENATEILSEASAELKVLNVQGTLIFTKKLAIGETELDIQAQSFPAGLYFVSLLKQGEVISTIKVVKN
jgi:uncharacterized repeat protein (TIGR01451 family)